MRVSAYIPAFNAADTIADAIAGILRQHRQVDEFFVVDDGCTDATSAIVAALGVEMVRGGDHRGRGAARALAMQRARGELVVCCDASNVLAPDFVARGLAWFEDARVAAVSGRIWQAHAESVALRWRGRHLYRLDETPTMQRDATLATGGAIVRRQAVLDVGNFDSTLVALEDRDLSARLHRADWEIIYDPTLCCESRRDESIGEVLARYCRWNPAPAPTLGGYIKSAWYAMRVLALRDLRARDAGSLGLSLLLPHYELLQQLRHKKT